MTPGSLPLPPVIGILALQGDFDAHAQALAGLAAVRLVRTPGDLAVDGGVSGLVLPGGESTTMIRLLRLAGLWDELLRLGHDGLPMLGTCAGAILLSREVLSPPQESLGLLDVSIQRNAYGRQVDSFEEDVPCPFLGGDLPVVCIRAPRFSRVGAGVEVLLSHRGEPLWVRQGAIWAVTFHPELTPDRRVHGTFLAQIRTRAPGAR